MVDMLRVIWVSSWIFTLYPIHTLGTACFPIETLDCQTMRMGQTPPSLPTESDFLQAIVTELAGPAPLQVSTKSGVLGQASNNQRVTLRRQSVLFRPV